MIRAEAITALRERKDHFAEVFAIFRSLMKDPAPIVRERAIFHLESFIKPGTPEESTLLPEVAAALDDASPAVRLEACRALYVYGQLPRAVPALMRLVREEKGIYRQGGPGVPAGGQDDPEGAGADAPRDARGRECSRTRHGAAGLDPDGRHRAGAGRSDPGDAGESAGRRASGGGPGTDGPGQAADGGVRHEGLGRPGRFRGAQRALQGLVQVLSGPGGAERLAAAEALIQVGRPEAAMPMLKELADHGDAATSAAAARLLDAARERGEAP